MTATDKTTLKGYFNTGDIPTETQFAALIDTLQQSFCPLDYGAVGDGTTDDTVAIQAAIDAASVSGGVVFLNGKDYRVTKQASYYALWVNANNVFIVGPGTLSISEAQASTQFWLLRFGNGGGAVPPGENGTWVENVGVIGVTLDATGLSKADRDSMDSAGGCMVGFQYCKHYIVQNSRFMEGWGDTIKSQNSSRYGLISGNMITTSIVGARNDGFDADGGRYTVVCGNVFEKVRIAVVLQANLDNGSSGYALYNKIYGNYALSCNQFVQLNGCSQSSVTGNYISGAASSATFNITSYASAVDKQETSYNLITNNYLYRANTAGTAFALAGYNANPFDGTPLLCQKNIIADNYVDAHYSTLVTLGEQANDNQFRNNIWDTPGTFTADDATPSVSTGFNVYRTANANPTTVTMLDDGYVGQRVTVIINDANTTIDFTASNLKGNGGGDWTPTTGDHMDCIFDGTNWYCNISDNTA